MQYAQWFCYNVSNETSTRPLRNYFLVECFLEKLVQQRWFPALLVPCNIVFLARSFVCLNLSQDARENCKIQRGWLSKQILQRWLKAEELRTWWRKTVECRWCRGGSFEIHKKWTGWIKIRGQTARRRDPQIKITWEYVRCRKQNS